MGRSESETIRRMAAVAIFGALSYVLTAFAAIPYAGGAGYFNFGDIIDLLAALLLGPLEGALVGILGGALSDLSMGYAIYAPWTILAKGLLGAVSGLLYIVLKKHKVMRFSSLFVGAILEILAYLPCYLLYLGEAGLVNSLFDCVQSFGSAFLVLPLFLLLEKTRVFSRLQG
jgi:uncharacterized membrane protein